jgi:hypothetical protein
LSDGLYALAQDDARAGHAVRLVCTENQILVDDVMEAPKLAE